LRREGESGAGHDDSDEEDEELAQERRCARKIGAGLEHQVRHAPMEVVESSCPFRDDAELRLFAEALDILKSQEVVPAGFNLEATYHPIETFRTGRCRKGISVPLLHEVWFPRVLLWCQALDLLKKFPMVVRGE
jgi:hypothetical protein